MPTLVDEMKTETEALLRFLEAQRGGLRRAAFGLTDEQARAKPTVSALSLGGLIKHVGVAERGWIGLLTGAEPEPRDWTDTFVMGEDTTLAELVATYEEVAGETEAVIRALPDLEGHVALPEGPWFPPGSTRSARWILLHLIEETARHAGHADIIRESLDGATAFELVKAAGD
jgi:uncharacterized damage-inducible protein DinB